jgi:hypothetical protein
VHQASDSNNLVTDWVQDAAKEQLRRKVRRKENAGFFERGGHVGWRYRLWESYEAAQGWIVVTLIGEYGMLEQVIKS